MKITLDDLARERNIFLIGFIIILAVNFLTNSYATFLLMREIAAGEAPEQAVYPIGRFGNWLVIVVAPILAFRISRFLDHALWLTIIYTGLCLVPPFWYDDLNLVPVFQVIAFVGLLFSVKKTGEMLKRDFSELEAEEEGK